MATRRGAARHCARWARHARARAPCRYRGDKESHDIGVTVGEGEPSFAHWARLWDIYHNRQLYATFRAIAQHSGLKVRRRPGLGDACSRACSLARSRGQVRWPGARLLEPHARAVTRCVGARSQRLADACTLTNAGRRARLSTALRTHALLLCER